MQFSRSQSIEKALHPKRILIIYGPRRVGKTTLLNAYLGQQHNKRILSVVGDNVRVQEVFDTRALDTLKRFVSGYDIVAIDEAQQVPHIGIGAKMLIDAFPEKQFILTGSSSFDLSNQVGEPLTGRHFRVTLLPIAQQEMLAGTFELTGALPDFLLYGSYPEILLAPDSSTKERILDELVSSYLYKDVLSLDWIKSPALLRDIARMIAFQIGHDVSLNEIAVALNTTVHTVARYLDLLEKMFVLKRVRGFSRNLRNEISKKARYYFLDNGVRNAVIGQFSPLSSRADVGALWENFIFTEFLKRDGIEGIRSEYYFWRTHTGSEIDIVRESGGRIDAYECTWSPRAKARKPAAFGNAYPEASFAVITPENYLDFLLKNPTQSNSNS